MSHFWLCSNQQPTFIFPCSQTKSASPRLRPRRTETRWTWRPSASSPRSSLLPSPASSTLPKNCPCSLRWVMVNGLEDQRASVGVWRIQGTINHSRHSQASVIPWVCIHWGNVWFRRWLSCRISSSSVWRGPQQHAVHKLVTTLYCGKRQTYCGKSVEISHKWDF